MTNPINPSDVLEFDEAQFFNSPTDDGIFLPDGFFGFNEVQLETAVGIGNTPTTLTTLKDPTTAFVAEMRRLDAFNDGKRFQNEGFSVKFILNYIAKFFDSAPVLKNILCNIKMVLSGQSTHVTVDHLEKLLNEGATKEALNTFEELMESGTVLPASTIELLLESGAEFAAKRAFIELTKSEHSDGIDVLRAFTALTKSGDGHFAFSELKNRRPTEAQDAFQILLASEAVRLGTSDRSSAIEIYEKLLRANPSTVLSTFQTVLRTESPIHPLKAFSMLLQSRASIDTARYAFFNVLAPADQADVKLKMWNLAQSSDRKYVQDWPGRVIRGEARLKNETEERADIRAHMDLLNEKGIFQQALKALI